MCILKRHPQICDPHKFSNCKITLFSCSDPVGTAIVFVEIFIIFIIIIFIICTAVGVEGDWLFVSRDSGVHRMDVLGGRSQSFKKIYSSCPNYHWEIWSGRQWWNHWVGVDGLGPR